MMRILLDTNVYAAYLQGKTEALNALGAAEQVYMSVIVLGELHAGFNGGTKAQINRKRLRVFLGKPGVRLLRVDEETAEIFGRVKHQLKTGGTPIPLNDVWIASQAIQNGAVLATCDRHFKYVAGLRLWDLFDDEP